MAVPKLRFKEFEGDWSTNKIEEISIVTSGGTPSRNVSDYWNGDIPWVTTSLVDFNVINEAEEFITQVGLDNSSAKLFPKDTILMAMYGQGITRGKVAILGIDATTNQACAAIKLKNGFETKFIFQNLMNRYEEIRDLSNEGGQKNLSAGIIKEILISFPEKEEQTKIASFLSNVDEKISQLTQKHELLSQYKQGMMQKLFSQQIRFKADDGSEFGEWDYLELNEVLDYEQPTKYIVKSTDYDSSYLTPVLTAGKTFILGYTNETSGIFEGDKENVIIFDDFTTAYKFVNFRFKVKSSAMKILKLNHFQNNIFYIYSVFSLLNLPLGDEHKRRWISEYSKQEIPVPCLEEQTKIANFLSAIDQKIEVVAQQIEQVKQWKKGLLQQMFV
ncbi:restriction endonuclease subunit S [Acinetobacter indicus]|nr:restriction endonuclease subunit S [Acinetobacter indicus]MDM1290172.1 restriction endonuclease subunit S [Acinetobacter indicus]MDM1320278.1 restriction endonuclease subunit S [Acinetobacter indicus]MDM1331830.1 restriction endonuclease subunit S [Acinetobacter indicus]